MHTHPHTHTIFSLFTQTDYTLYRHSLQSTLFIHVSYMQSPFSFKSNTTICRLREIIHFRLTFLLFNFTELWKPQGIKSKTANIFPLIFQWNWRLIYNHIYYLFFFHWIVLLWTLKAKCQKDYVFCHIICMFYSKTF